MWSIQSTGVGEQMYSPSGKNSEFLRVLISFVFLCVEFCGAVLSSPFFVNSFYERKNFFVHQINFLSFLRSTVTFCMFAF